MTTFLSPKIHPPPVSCSLDKITPDKKYKPQSKCHIVHQEICQSNRRHVLASAGLSLISVLAVNCCSPPLVAWGAEAGSNQQEKEDQKDESLVGAFKSLFDPNEKTKTGKVLPKAYLNSAREVVKTLRDSVNEDPNDNAKFRRTADAAKESIREYLATWRGEKTVVNEESYAEIVKVIRSLASFYSKAGPSAPLPGELKSEILNHLDIAETFL